MSTSGQKNAPESAGVESFLRVFRAFLILVVAGLLAWFVYTNAIQEGAKYPFKLGLDLAGGSHLVYEADVSGIDAADVPELMNVLRLVIERRINMFGVSEPIVQVEESSMVSGESHERLVVELPGVTDVEAAVAEIGRTPLLEFKLIDEAALSAASVKDSFASSTTNGSGTAVIGNIKVNGEIVDPTNPYIETGLTGRYLKSSVLEFTSGQGGQLSGEPIVTIHFNDEGAQLFEDITRAHVGERLAIFLDGEMISAPQINEAISGGTAVVSGGFTVDEARDLAQNLNFGALPVPITLDSVQKIDATLGAGVIAQSYLAGVTGFSLIMLFLVAWYRVPGLVAGVALLTYIVMNLAVFMFIPVTLTAAGLAGFVLSLGMAVDANVLVFERMKEEFRSGKSSRAAALEGFSRAWGAIRDGNVTGLISAIILFWFGTAMIKGFALVLGVGIIISVFSAIVVTRTLLIALPDTTKEKGGWWAVLLGTGLKK